MIFLLRIFALTRSCWAYGELRLLNLAERKKVFQIFSDLFRYPDALSHGDFGQYIADLAHLLNLELPSELSQIPDLTELETSYTGLFVNSYGGTPAPPYGSVYLDAGGLLMGESCLNVAECYAAENLNLQGSDEPPDFLATELEFFYYLLAEEEAALAQEDSVRLADLQEKQKDFFENYLSPWLPEFCGRIFANSSEPFYLWVGKALQHFCDTEKAARGNK